MFDPRFALSLISVFVWTLLSSNGAAAQSGSPVTSPAIEALPSAAEIVRNINNRDEGESVTRTLSMQLIDRRGKIRERNTRGYRKYYDVDKHTILFYLSPKNVKDTAFLTYDYADSAREDDQWLYLPAMRKVRRISASDRGDYFLGTDLTYEDMKLETRVSERDYHYKTLGKSEVDGHECFLIEATPVDETTARELGYSKVESCIDAEIWMARRSRFWDIRGNLLKTVHAEDIRQVQGIWTQHKLSVENHKTGHTTLLTFSEIDYQSPIEDSIFSKTALKRGI